MSDSLAQKAQLMLRLSQALLLGHIVFYALWTLVLAPPAEANPWVIFGVQVFMLLCFVPGVLKGNPRTCAWLCFVLLVYFCGAVLYSFSPTQGKMGLIQMLLNTGLFTTALLYIRWQGKARKAAAGIVD